jgi:predicted HD superfamily hydrolase involved in NAD metabolism
VADYAIEIAKSNYLNLDKAYMAGMLHDVAKEFSDRELVKITKNISGAKSHPTVGTLHGLAGSIYIQKEFGITDQEIINAIANHVIPTKNCSTLSKLIYVADKLEGNKYREIENGDKIKELAKVSINQAFDLLKASIETKYI